VVVQFALLITLLLSVVSAQAQTGLFYTPQEITVWQDRAVNGLYKSAGDAGPGTPGDWDRIVANAQNFLNDPDQDHITGQPAGTCWDSNDDGEPGNHANDPEDVSTAGWRMADAGFYYLITGDTNYATAVRNELMSQAAEPGVDFRDRDEWRFLKPLVPFLAVFSPFGAAL
jgi:hypothetical protein